MVADLSFKGLSGSAISNIFFPVQKRINCVYENRKEIAKEVGKVGLGTILAVGSSHVANPIASAVLRAAGAAGLTYALVGWAFAGAKKVIGLFSETKAESFAKMHGSLRDAVFGKRHIILIAGVCVGALLSPAVGGFILGIDADSWKGERAQAAIQA